MPRETPQESSFILKLLSQLMSSASPRGMKSDIMRSFLFLGSMVCCPATLTGCSGNVTTLVTGVPRLGGGVVGRGRSEPRNGGTEPRNARSEPRNGPSEPGNARSEPRNGPSEPGNRRSEPRNGGSEPGNGAPFPGQKPPKT